MFGLLGDLRNCPPAAASSSTSIPKPTRTNLFIQYLPATFGSAELRSLFQPFGTVVSCSVMVNVVSGRSKGVGFVMFHTGEEASAALHALNGKACEGKLLRVTYAFHPLRPAQASLNSTRKDSVEKSLSATEKRNLYIKGVPSNWSPDDLRITMSRFGEVLHAAVSTAGGSLVAFREASAAAAAVKALQCDNWEQCDSLLDGLPPSLFARYARHGVRTYSGASRIREKTPSPTLTASFSQSVAPILSPPQRSPQEDVCRTSVGVPINSTLGPLMRHDPYGHRAVTEISIPQSASTSPRQPSSARSALSSQQHHGTSSAHSCRYCNRGTSVVLQNMPFEPARCEIAVHQTLGGFGEINYIECVGDGQAIATFTEHYNAVAAVQCMSGTVYAVSLLDCTARPA